MNSAYLANLLQASRGPILLITVGVLMVIDYNTPFSFGQTWPALIIVFGILKLAERMVSPPQSRVPAPYTPGVPPGFQPPPGGYPAGGYQGSTYEPGPGYQPPPQNPGGGPQ